MLLKLVPATMTSQAQISKFLFQHLFFRSPDIVPFGYNRVLKTNFFNKLLKVDFSAPNNKLKARIRVPF